MNRFMDWIKTYPYIVLIGFLMVIVISVWLNIALRSEEKSRRLDLQQKTYDAAIQLATEKHITDSISAYGDNQRLENQVVIIQNQKVIEAKLDSILKEMRGQ